MRPLEHVVGILKPQLALSEYIGSIADDEVAVSKLALELVRRAKLGDEPALEAWTLRKLYGREFYTQSRLWRKNLNAVGWPWSHPMPLRGPDAGISARAGILVALWHGTLETTDQVRHLK